MTKKDVVKNIVLPIGIVFISIVFAIVFNDFGLGILTLLFGFLNAYYMAIGKWYNYLYGIAFSVTYSITSAFNGFYGFAIFTVIIYTPIQIVGLVNWFKKRERGDVLVKSLGVKTDILLTLFVVLGSLLVGFLLGLIPTQNLPYLDAVSQILNLSGIILSCLRLSEQWIIFLFNNIADLAIWITNCLRGGPNAQMMLVVSIMYLVMNIYGWIYWVSLERKQKQNKFDVIQLKKESQDNQINKNKISEE